MKCFDFIVMGLSTTADNKVSEGVYMAVVVDSGEVFGDCASFVSVR